MGSVHDVVYDRVQLKDVARLDESRYAAGGGTALVDAIARSVRHIVNVHKYIREEDRPEKTVFVITTDGEENSSVEFSASELRKMVAGQRERFGWEFLFLGANIDAVETAERYGMRKDRAVRYYNDSRGIGRNYECLSDAVHVVRECGSVPDGWSEGIESDYKSRKG